MSLGEVRGDEDSPSSGPLATLEASGLRVSDSSGLRAREAQLGRAEPAPAVLHPLGAPPALDAPARAPLPLLVIWSRRCAAAPCPARSQPYRRRRAPNGAGPPRVPLNAYRIWLASDG
jgi:hypothetical protein